MSEVKFMAEQIERRPTDALIPYARNARLHDSAQVSKIAASMREFGWTYAVLIDEEDGILCGHGRVLAAQKLKLAEVPVMVARGWSEAQKRAYILADNRLSLDATWDTALLKIELGDLQSSGFDIGLTGFSTLELTNLFSTIEGETDADEATEPAETPISLPGDLWCMQDHRLLCGDSTSKEDVDRLLAGKSPHLLLSDQPFGVGYSPSWRTTDVPQVGKFKSPNRSHATVKNDDRADWREAWALFAGDVAYVWHDGSNPAATQLALEACAFEIRSQIIWRKTSMVVGRGHYHYAHESCFYAVRKGKNGHWVGDRKQTTVWDIDAPKRAETGHGTQKPVECMARAVRNNSAVGDVIYEPFSGSFTTGIACHENKRVCLAMEIEPRWVDAGVLRWERFTGLKATLAETGETFEEVRARRSEVV